MNGNIMSHDEIAECQALASRLGVYLSSTYTAFTWTVPLLKAMIQREEIMECRIIDLEKKLQALETPAKILVEFENGLKS